MHVVFASACSGMFRPEWMITEQATSITWESPDLTRLSNDIKTIHIQLVPLCVWDIQLNESIATHSYLLVCEASSHEMIATLSCNGSILLFPSRILVCYGWRTTIVVLPPGRQAVLQDEVSSRDINTWRRLWDCYAWSIRKCNPLQQ